MANLWKARKKWVWIYRVIGREGVNVQTLGGVFKAVVQAVLLFRS